MAYIDRTLVQKCLDDLSSENLIGNENDTFISLAEAKDRIEELPTADVVPKSEVEKFEIEIEALKIANEKMYEAFKRQAMEIFEEIEKLIFGYMSAVMPPNTRAINHVEFAELKKKYTEEQT